MSKKSFAGGLDSLLSSSSDVEEISEKASKKSKKEQIQETITSTAEKEIEAADPVTRYTFFVKKANLEKIQALAWWERRLVKDIANEAIDVYLESKDTKHVNQALKEYAKSKK